MPPSQGAADPTPIPSTSAQSYSYSAMPRPPAVASSYSALDFRKDFFFRRRHGALDWNKLRSVDLERVVRTVDVDALQENVEHITFADITEQDLAQLTDANFLQLFRLTQLIIEYLLNVQNFLLASAKKKESTYEQVLAELDATRAALNERVESERAAKKELKYCRRVIKAYEKNLGARYSDPNQAPPPPPSKCEVCGSVFVNHEYLVGHYRRRHPNEEPPAAPIVPTPAQAQPAVVQQAPQQQIDLAAWKKEMEAAIRASLVDSQRAAASIASNRTGSSNKEDLGNDNVLNDRLSKLEATLSAVLNKNTLPPTHEPSPMIASRAGALRDDDGGARLLEDQGSLKEYLRRELFDLREEVMQLREQAQEQRKEQAYFAPYHATHEPMGGTVAAAPQQPFADPSQSTDQAQNLLQRFRTSPVIHSPHPPNYPHTLPIPHGTGTVPRHLPQGSLTPVPPAPREPLISTTDPKAIRKARDALLKHHEKRYTLFPDLPGILSRFPHTEQDLVGHLNSFAVLSATLAEQRGGAEEVESEMRAQGCEELLPEIEQFAEAYVRMHYSRPPELVEALRAHAERSAKFDALGNDQKAREAFNEAARVQWQKEKQALEAIRREQEAIRLAEEERIHQEREAAQQADREAQQRNAARQQQLAQFAAQQSPLASPDPLAVHRPPPLSALSPSPSFSPLPTSPFIPQIQASPSPVSSAELSPSPYPVASPTPEEPTGSPNPAQSPSRKEFAVYNMEPITSTAASSQQQQQPPAFSMNPGILNPQAAVGRQGTTPSASGGQQHPTTHRAATLPTSTTTQPKSILKKTGTTINILKDMSDEEDEFEEEEKKLPGGSSMNTFAAANLPQGVSKTNLFSPPPAVPVPIPARPNKAAIAAMSKTVTSGGGSVGPSPSPSPPLSLEPKGPNDVEAFVAEPPTPVGPKKTERRLSARAGELEEAGVGGSETVQPRSTRNGSITQPLPVSLEPDREYEHSTARQDLDGDDGLETEYEQREAERAEQQQSQQLQGGEDDVHHFSPPASQSPLVHPRQERTGRLHSDDEGDDVPTALTASVASTRIPPSISSAPASRPRNIGDLRNIQPGHSRFGAATSHSANFSVASSGDWKSDAEILDDDVEELIA